MKKVVIILCVSLLGLSMSNTLVNNKLPRRYKKIQKYIDQATSDRLTGISIYIKSPKFPEWIACSGYADQENKLILNKDHIFSMASIGKMYNAVAVLKLAEEGLINLNDKIADYLPKEIIQNLPGANMVTIRLLLSHKTGWVNYDHDPELSGLYFSGKLKLDTLTHLNALRRYMYGKDAICQPGTEHNYSSTNYMILAMIIDKVVPEGHTFYLNKLIKQYGYSNTCYRQTPPHKNVSYYGDLNQDGVVEDLTEQTFETTNWFIGDDGVYASIGDAAHFLQDLMDGKILNQQSLKEMKTWDKEKDPDYGLGLMIDKSFPYGLTYGHSGRGIGTTTDLFYFPKQDMTIAIFCNTGLRNSDASFNKSYYSVRFKIIKKIFLL